MAGTRRSTAASSPFWLFFHLSQCLRIFFFIIQTQRIFITVRIQRNNLTFSLTGLKDLTIPPGIRTIITLLFPGCFPLDEGFTCFFVALAAAGPLFSAFFSVAVFSILSLVSVLLPACFFNDFFLRDSCWKDFQSSKLFSLALIFYYVVSWGYQHPLKQASRCGFLPYRIEW